MQTFLHQHGNCIFSHFIRETSHHENRIHCSLLPGLAFSASHDNPSTTFWGVHRMEQSYTKWTLFITSACRGKLEDEIRRLGIDVDTFTTYLNHVTLTLTFDLQNLIKSSVEASEYSLSVLSKLFKPFVRYHGNNMWPDERINKRDNVTV